MPDIASVLHIVQTAESPDRPRLTPASWFADLAPGLETLGGEETACRGGGLQPARPGLRLRIVTRGVLALTHPDTGLCMALVGAGRPVAPFSASGKWLTDGALADIGFDALAEAYGAARALDVWTRAADLCREAVETELVCSFRHAASRRYGRWFGELLKDADVAFLTQSELAELSGLQRTSACAAMATLQARRALKVTRGRIMVRDRTVLEREGCRCGMMRVSAQAPEMPTGGPCAGEQDDAIRRAG